MNDSRFVLDVRIKSIIVALLLVSLVGALIMHANFFRRWC